MIAVAIALVTINLGMTIALFCLQVSLHQAIKFGYGEMKRSDPNDKRFS